MDKKPNLIPSSPGIYFFKKGIKVLYIGKAQNLSMRLKSYFSSALEDIRKQRMVEEADSLLWTETQSDAEALIREAEMIKKYRPPYNILMRDDKQYFYVGFTPLEIARPKALRARKARARSLKGFTKDIFPKIFLTHQPTINKKIGNSYIGPFTDGAAIKYVLRVLRRAFPYCVCKETHTRPCQQSAIGNCVGVCCIDPLRAREFFNDAKDRARIYKKNIRAIRTILSGKGKRLLETLKKEMGGASQKKEYEKAAILRNKIFALENIFTHKSLLRRDEKTHKEKGLRYLADALNLKEAPRRIEAYDISNTQGKKPVGSMVVFTDGMPDKNEYRHFNIRLPEKPNDVAMIKEIVLRRLDHPEWTYPDVMIIDGGKAQLNAAIAALSNFQFSISNFQSIFNFQKNSKPQIANNKSQIIPKIIALAKREEELYLPDGKIIKLKEGPQPLLHLLQHIRNEAHRFAITHHRKRRSHFS